MNSAWVRRRLNSSPRQFFLLCQMFFVQNIFFFVLEGSPTFSLHLKIIAFLNVARTKGKCSGLLSARWEQAVLDVLLDGKYCTEKGQHLVAPSRAEQSTDPWFIEISNHMKRWESSQLVDALILWHVTCHQTLCEVPFAAPGLNVSTTIALFVGPRLQLPGLGAGESWKGGWMKVQQREVFLFFFDLFLFCSF